MCIMLIAVNAAVLDLMHYGTTEDRQLFCFLYVIPPLFFFFRWWCVVVCVPLWSWGQEKKKKKKRASRWIWVAAVTKTRFPGLLFVCSQPIGGQRLSPTIHSCKKTGNVGKPWWLWRGLRENDRERENHTREREREGPVLDPVSLCSPLCLFWT